MLSYQHLYHAGNPADVHKHAFLCYMLDYIIQKDKPLSYIETHAGRGFYQLDTEESLKTGEAAQGIVKLEQYFTPDHPYVQRLSETRAGHGPNAYPGSPLLAALTLREMDSIHLAELHPAEHRILHETLTPWGAFVHKQDGLQLALAICPPTPRRGLMLIDPSYEVKEDYVNIPKVIAAIRRKWNVGIIALWYPILGSNSHNGMLEALHSDHPDALTHEVRFPPVRDGHRMVGSGMFILNPPYGLEAEAERLSRIFGMLNE
ncbi:MAG: 23S rRNA (adenine(2030)-N(6))-methyltransferase RlmJ [Paracoccaceae bacterium]|nr:23S rRNA (adenine(2030)-N(6))-methyltransferase RlmJ [Paracoccaceae bacterium]